MGIDVHVADESERERWDDLASRAPQGTPFHRRAALDVLGAYADADVYPLIGVKGQEPVGLFPVFVTSVGPVAAAFSPPPDLRIPYLGPALLSGDGLKRRKADRRHRRFVDGCVEWLDEEVGPRYVHLRTDTAYEDPRPLLWQGFDVTPAHTYVVDLTPSPEDLLMRFSSDARRNVRKGGGEDVVVREEGVASARRVVEAVRARYEEQDIDYRVDPAFVADLYEELPDGQLRPYVCRIDGAFVGGMLTVESDDVVYRWQGAVDHDADAPANDLLDWHIMQAARERGVERYDMVGADTPRLNRYKAKFGPGLATYQRAERASLPVRFAARLYQRLR